MTEQASTKSFCIVRLSALGDVVMVLPLVRLLQKGFPGCRITWVIGKGMLAVVGSLAGEGIEFIPIDKPRKPSDYLAFKRCLADREFDAVLCLQASWRANWLYPCIKAKRKIGYGADRAKDLHRFFVREAIPPAKPHIVDGFYQFAEALGLEIPGQAEWRLPLDPAAQVWAEQTLPKTPFFTLSPCASKPERDWPVDRYAAVLSVISQKGMPIVLLGGNTEREKQMASQILAMSGAQALNLVGKTNLAQLFATLAKCTVLLSPDTGAVHIANAYGRPVVGLYAVAPSSRTGPYGNLQYCADCFDLAVKELLGKDPARVPWAQRVHHPKAMELISVSSVLANIEKAVNNS